MRQTVEVRLTEEDVREAILDYCNNNCDCGISFESGEIQFGVNGGSPVHGVVCVVRASDDKPEAITETQQDAH